MARSLVLPGIPTGLFSTFHAEATSNNTLGAKCGASFINNSSKRWLQRVLKDEYKKLDPRSDGEIISGHVTEGGAMRTLMERFERHKKAFHKDSADMQVELSESLRQVNIRVRVEQGDLTISKYTNGSRPDLRC